MKIKKIIICTLVIFLGMSCLCALTLEQVTQGLAEHKVTAGDFTQIKTISTSKGSRDIQSSGTYILSSQGVMWNTQKPLATKLIVTETKMIQIDSKNKESIMDGSDNLTFMSISSTIASLFSNDLSVLQAKFSLVFQEKGNNAWALELTPKDATLSSVIKTLVLEGNCTDETCTLTSLTMMEVTGGKIQYVFTSQSYPDTIEDPLMKSYLD